MWFAIEEERERKDIEPLPWQEWRLTKQWCVRCQLTNQDAHIPEIYSWDRSEQNQSFPKSSLNVSVREGVCRQICHASRSRETWHEQIRMTRKWPAVSCIGPCMWSYRHCTGQKNLEGSMRDWIVKDPFPDTHSAHHCLRYVFIYLFSLFRGCTCGTWKFPGWIRAAAAGLHHSHSDARSFTHWARPGIEPTSSWILVGLVTTEPQWNPCLWYL